MSPRSILAVGVLFWLPLLAAASHQLPTVPLHFEPNQGQYAPDVRFGTRTSEVQVYLRESSTEVIVGGGLLRRHLTMQFAGAAAASLHGEDSRTGRSHYYRGDDRGKWLTQVPHFGQVRARGIYRGIDVVYYGAGRTLEYDFVVSPGSDPSQIRLNWSGPDSIRLNADGDLILATGSRNLVQRKPIAWQMAGGEKKPVPVRYELSETGEATLALGAYRRDLELVIDPVLVYSSYLGGSLGADRATALAVDAAGAVYVAGWTEASNFPNFNAADSSFGGPREAFVTKLNANGDAIEYSTFLGGVNSYPGGVLNTCFAPGLTTAVGPCTDAARAIVVDSSGSVVVAGERGTSDFPTAGTQPISAGSPTGFVARLGPGGALTFAFGAPDAVQGVAIDDLGSIYIAGTTRRPDMAVVNAVQPSPRGCVTNAGNVTECQPELFVGKIVANGTVTGFLSYVGGTASDISAGIAVDVAGSAYLTGYTDSSDFPITPNAYQTQLPAQTNAFLCKLNPNGTGYSYSTYLGGSADDRALAIRVMPTGTSYVAGGTTSSNFPTVGTLRPFANHGQANLFLTKFNADGVPTFSTFYGGTQTPAGFPDVLSGLALDGAGAVAIAGHTYTPDFPLNEPYPGQAPGATAPKAFLAKINTDVPLVTFSTTFGGTNGNTFGTAVAMDNATGIYLAGWTTSTTLPLLGGVDSTVDTNGDGFVLKFRDAPANATVATFNTSPAGLRVRVDGADVATPQTYVWGPNSSHTIAAYSQGVGTSFYEFASWSNGGAASHTVTASQPGPIAYTANYVLRPCSYSVSGPTTRLVNGQTGGAFSVAVNTVPGCTWTAQSSTSWLFIQSQTSNQVLITWSATGGTGNTGTITVAGQTITVNRLATGPALLAPTPNQNIPTRGVTFTWAAYTGAPVDGYRLRVREGARTVFSGGLLGQTTSTLIRLSTGQYRAEVAACQGQITDESTCTLYSGHDFTVAVPAPTGAPSIASPTQNQTFSASTQSFEWSTVAGAARYDVLLTNTAQGSAPELQISSRNPSTVFSMRSGTYDLQVRACTEGCGPWSPAVRFSVNLPPIPTAAPASVTNSLGPNTVSVSWSSVANADLYIVQIVQPDTGPGGGALTVASIRTASTFVTLGVPRGPADIIVAGCNGNGCGPYSPNQRIVVLGPNPAAPVMGSPISGTSVDGPLVFLSWSRVPTDDGFTTPYRLYVGDLSRDAPALDIRTAQNFWAAYFRSEGARYDALAVSNPDTAQSIEGAPAGFNVRGTTSPAPTIAQPRHQGTVASGNITIAWTPVPGATLYQYAVAIPGQIPSITGVSPDLLVQVPIRVTGAPVLYSAIARACQTGQTCSAESDAGWGPWSNQAGPGVSNFTVLP